VCTLAVYSATLPSLPLVIAANRDEFHARPTDGPGRLGASGRAFGGRDLVAGGSWLAIGESGVVVGVLNRRTEGPPDPTCASRGTLCVSLAEAPSVEAALALLEADDASRYNPFNLLIADRGIAYVAQNRGGLHVQHLEPGLHLLTNLDLDDPTCPRISRSTGRFAEVGRRFEASRDRDALVDDLREVLSDHQVPLDDRRPTDQLCIHMPGYGTRSSSVILLDEAGATKLHYAPGAPCGTPYRETPLPWA